MKGERDWDGHLNHTDARGLWSGVGHESLGGRRNADGMWGTAS